MFLMKVAGIAVMIVAVSVSAFLLLITVLNRIFYSYAGGAKRPVFFDVRQTYPALLELELRHKMIREELDSILPDKERMPKYHEVDVLQYGISGVKNPDKDWKVFMLYTMGRRPKVNRERCPRTCDLLEEVPNLFQAFFSILDGGKSIPAHPGPYLGYLRYHLGLKVPERNPPTIRIKDQYYTWKEGEGVLFDDSWQHEVYNKSDDIRVVLIVDVLRPMPRLLHTINVLVKPLIGFFYVRGILGLSEVVRALQRAFRKS